MASPLALITKYDNTVERNDMIGAVRCQDHAYIHLIDGVYPGTVNDIVGGESAMVVAAKMGQCDTLELLHSLGADPNLAVDEDGTTPLFVLISECPPMVRPHCLSLMLNWGGVQIDAMCDLQTPLEYLGGLGSVCMRIHSGDLASMKTLIKQGAHVGQGTVTNSDTRDRLITWTEGEMDSGLNPAKVVTRLKRCNLVLEREREIDQRCCYAERYLWTLA
jgi:hypothetical protein